MTNQTTLKIKDPAGRLAESERFLPEMRVENVMSVISALRYDSLRFEGEEGTKYKNLLLALRYYANGEHPEDEPVSEVVRAAMLNDSKTALVKLPGWARMAFLFNTSDGTLDPVAAAIIRAADIKIEKKVDQRGIASEALTYANPLDLNHKETAEYNRKREEYISNTMDEIYHGDLDPMFAPRPDMGDWRSGCRKPTAGVATTL